MHQGARRGQRVRDRHHDPYGVYRPPENQLPRGYPAPSQGLMQLPPNLRPNPRWGEGFGRVLGDQSRTANPPGTTVPMMSSEHAAVIPPNKTHDDIRACLKKCY